MKNISLAVAALSALTVAQPSFAGGHRNPLHTTGHTGNGVLRLGELYTNCCGGIGNDASAQIVNSHGFGVQLQVTQPSCCNATFAATGIENIAGTNLHKSIIFTLSGLNGAPPAVSNFGVDVVWTPAGTNQEVFNFFTVANGGLIPTGHNQFVLVTGGQNGITPGSTLIEVAFELDGNCVSTKQTATISNVLVDKSPVNYDLDSLSAFCGGCS